ncbi:TPA: PerC family transcriptional regulator [Escherichia coli]|uniref:PerC family transcriptional regulator n=1 Tax=Escherichia coli TaxID=562 RepID=A0A6L7A097_ECOLX|nr:PerC family transcriptional regulator [Escherichia coli]EEY3521792.1 PerC family transcriptional regulator [Escherichia coli]EGO4139200.1 PerC family transcriptional regulator [Escherichia coli]EGO4194713.1 PerC family transcriptional regulator [Escherichia coli]EHL5737984.1 PerC family transcriptional regulator [Escherichia coli]EHL6432738.1 PerC family transcriptional regulator [Escherichia coli]
MIHDDKAEALENSGLWRRAAERWGELFRQAKSDEERHYITQRRAQCTAKATRPRKAEWGHVCAVREAATRTLKDMGIDLRKEDPLRGTPTGISRNKKQGG